MRSLKEVSFDDVREELRDNASEGISLTLLRDSSSCLGGTTRRLGRLSNDLADEKAAAAAAEPIGDVGEGPALLDPPMFVCSSVSCWATSGVATCTN